MTEDDHTDAKRNFQRIALHRNFPMVIVTTAFGEQKAGCLVGFNTQCSVDPPRYLICSSQKNFTYSVLTNADHLAIHFLSQEHMHLAELFGGNSGHSFDKFAHCKWHLGDYGIPLLDECNQWLIGSIVDRHKLGDHKGYVVEPVVAHYEPLKADPIMFQQVKHLEPGHDP